MGAFRSHLSGEASRRDSRQAPHHATRGSFQVAGSITINSRDWKIQVSGQVHLIKVVIVLTTTIEGVRERETMSVIYVQLIFDIVTDLKC